MPLNIITLLAVDASEPVTAVATGCIIQFEGGPIGTALLQPAFFMWNNPIGPVKAGDTRAFK
jgi:hypothetical protein